MAINPEDIAGSTRKRFGGDPTDSSPFPGFQDPEGVHSPRPETGIDFASIFGDLKAQVDALTQQQLLLGRSDISQGAARATDVANEAFAGSGLGRSGVAAGTFQNIAQKRESDLQRFSQSARLQGDQAKLAIDETVSRLEADQKIREFESDEEQRRHVRNVKSQMELMTRESLLTIAANDSTFWEEWGPVFDLIGGAVSLIPGGSAVAGIGTRIGGGRRAV